MAEPAGAAIAPFALAVGIGAVILALTGHEPVSVYRLMIEEAFGGERRIAATLTRSDATPADRARRGDRVPGRRFQRRRGGLLLSRGHRRRGRGL